MAWRLMGLAALTMAAACGQAVAGGASTDVVLAALAPSLRPPGNPPPPPPPPRPPRPLGQWGWELGAGASVSSGNTESATGNFNVDGELMRAHSKWTINGHVLYARDDVGTTAEQAALDTRYDHDLTPRSFLFSQAGALRDRPANLDLRLTVGAGVGRHLIATPQNTWDVIIGLGYSQDRYRVPTLIDDRIRQYDNRVELLLGENSTHRLTETTTFRQQLSLSPPLVGSGLRAEWKAGLAVAMTQTLKLTVNASLRYNGDPGTGVKTTDTLLVTGVSYTLY